MPTDGQPEDASHRGVLIADRQTDVRIDAEHYRMLVQWVLKAEGAPSGSETSVTFVGPDEMAQLNEAHMGNDGPTDVLAFPLDLAGGIPAGSEPADADVLENLQQLDEVPIGDVLAGEVLVGDVVVCPAVAAVNAEAGADSRPGHDGSVGAEIDLLVVHGVLHLLGMDHADPASAAAMRSREAEHLQRTWARA